MNITLLLGMQASFALVVRSVVSKTPSEQLLSIVGLNALQETFFRTSAFWRNQVVSLLKSYMCMHSATKGSHKAIRNECVLERMDPLTARSITHCDLRCLARVTMAPEMGSEPRMSRLSIVDLEPPNSSRCQSSSRQQEAWISTHAEAGHPLRRCSSAPAFQSISSSRSQRKGTFIARLRHFCFQGPASPVYPEYMIGDGNSEYYIYIYRNIQEYGWRMRCLRFSHRGSCIFLWSISTHQIGGVQRPPIFLPNPDAYGACGRQYLHSGRAELQCRPLQGLGPVPQR